MHPPISAVARHPALSRKASYRHWATDQVRWSDTDLVGHANHLSVGAYVETGRALFMRHFVAPEAPQRVMMLTVQLVVNYLGETHWPDQVQIGTGLLWTRSSSCSLGHAVFQGERCVATAETVVVAIDEQTRASRPIPQWLVDWLHAYRIEAQ